jgi:hypothetical protein
MSVSVDPDLSRVCARLGGLALMAALCVPAAGCSKKAARDTMAPESQHDAKGGEAEGADSDDPVAELDALEARMRAFGLATADTKLGAESASSEDVDDAGADDGDRVSDKAPDRSRDEVAGAAPAPAVNESLSPEEAAQSRCGDLCDLSESICMLEVRICSMSESHATDPIYADACERAVDDCHTAGEACDRCDA